MLWTQLALKHRINKRQEQRVIAFVASPVQETVQELQALGTRMKKNKVAIDIVSFGEDGENQEKLSAFVTAVNSGDNSHFLSIATKPYVSLSEELAGSAVFGGSMAMAGGAMDDDLEMAIRLSLQEQGGGAAGAGAGAAPTAAHPNAMAVDDDDAMMAQAIAMSMGVGANNGDGGGAPSTEGGAPAAEQQPPAGNNDIDEDLELAIRLSMQDSMDVDVPAATPNPDESEEKVDNEFLQSLVQNLEGVDPNDPNIKELLSALNPEAKKEDKDKKPEDK
jgi:26S proteasome regulatory subunit N10